MYHHKSSFFSDGIDGLARSEEELIYHLDETMTIYRMEKLMIHNKDPLKTNEQQLETVK